MWLFRFARIILCSIRRWAIRTWWWYIIFVCHFSRCEIYTPPLHIYVGMLWTWYVFGFVGIRPKYPPFCYSAPLLFCGMVGVWFEGVGEHVLVCPSSCICALLYLSFLFSWTSGEECIYIGEIGVRIRERIQWRESMGHLYLWVGLGSRNENRVCGMVFLAWWRSWGCVQLVAVCFIIYEVSDMLWYLSMHKESSATLDKY